MNPLRSLRLLVLRRLNRVFCRCCGRFESRTLACSFRVDYHSEERSVVRPHPEFVLQTSINVRRSYAGKCPSHVCKNT